MSEQGVGMPDQGERDHRVSSVDNALTLLSALRDLPLLSVKEAATLLGVAPSTAHRLLTTLQRHRFVVQERSTRRYGAGPALVDIALSALERLDVRRAARPHLVALSAELGETVSLVVLEGTTVRHIDAVEGNGIIRVAARTGEVRAAHCTSSGKVLLAGLSAKELHRLYKDEVLLGATPQSITSRQALFAALDEVRRNGYATNFEESSRGVAALSVAVADPHGHQVAAISVAVPSAALSPADVDRFARVARAGATRVEAELGKPG